MAFNNKELNTLAANMRGIENNKKLHNEWIAENDIFELMKQLKMKNKDIINEALCSHGIESVLKIDNNTKRIKRGYYIYEIVKSYVIEQLKKKLKKKLDKMNNENLVDP